LALGLVRQPFFGAWTDKSAGLPLLENFPTKQLGTDETTWIVLEDKSGRLFVGGNRLHVFDGESWRSFPTGNTYALRAMALGDDGRIWAGAINEVGYFEEESLGNFKYHSLLSQLPKEQQLVGDIWGCAVIGRAVYFYCRDKVLRWDGADFQILPFAGTTRLFPFKLGEEYWFHHLETGLYRLAEPGPQLEVSAAMLPDAPILGLARDKEGLLLAASTGLYRPGNPSRRISNDELSQFITDSRLASFASLPDGNYVIGTVNGGMTIVSPTGTILRVFNTGDGLLNRTVFSLRADSNGHVWSATPTGIFNFEGQGHASVFNPLNGLTGNTTDLIRLPDARLFGITLEGIFQLEADGKFRRLPQLTAIYNHLLPFSNGLLLSRHGGMDFFDGSTVQPVFSLTANAVFFAKAARTDARTIFLSEGHGLSRLDQKPNGTFVYTLLTKLPDSSISLHEDSQKRLWLGTATKGAFVYDPAIHRLSPINDPTNGTPLSERIFILGTAESILLLLDGRILQAQPDGTGLKVLDGVPAINPLFALGGPGIQDILIAYKRPTATNSTTQGLGILTIGKVGHVQWRELDVPAIRSVGSVSTMEFSEENGRMVLWVGGTEGVLRLDYDEIPPVTKPTTPFIRLDTLNSRRISDVPGFTFPSQNHRLNFKVFTGEYTRSKDWLLQSRLGNADWSAPGARRTFEFSNLSEGDYRFEVRTVNAAGLASEPSVFAFRILPPWYRSTWAILAYAAALGLAVLVVIRVRERRIRARNQELETLVGIRTAELVKANAAKDEFLAGISHEIRNPMNGVIGIADNFRTDSLDQESRRKFGLLRQCATHLSSLLEDILDFSKVQAGAVEIEAKPFNLPELMDSIAAMTAAESEKRGIPVEIAVSPAVPAQLVGDPKRVRQILLNFVSNALKFSGRGQVSVTVWCKPPGPATAEVIFAVSDEGPGISPEEQQRLFTRFERGAAAQEGRVPGTGLGLALCKGLAEKMGGRIWLESEPGRGSCFSFSAPFEIAEPATPSLPVAPPSAPDRPKAALVVDDQEYNRIVLTDLLETLSFTVHTAGDGTAALALAGSQDFDAVFLDYNLPGLSGLEVSRGIRALPNKSAGAAILAITAFSTPEKRSQCLAAGMNAFIGKPVTMERLRKALAAAMPAGPATTLLAPARPPADGLANLRLLARKKGAPFAGELALYLSEFEVEHDQLAAAVQREDAAATAHYAHLLYGRSAFIAERELELTLREIEAGSATGHWDEVRRLGKNLAGQVAGLRVRLVSSDPVAPPA
jgi:signal transduction histidine kinase/CheY-like chemotaxis protein